MVVESCTERAVFNGPSTEVFGPFMSHVETRRAKTLAPNEWIKVRNTQTGNIVIERGPALVFFGAYEEQVHPANATSSATAIALDEMSYCVVKNDQTGQLRVERGPKLWFPVGIYDNVLREGRAMALNKFQYVKLVDKQTGIIRVERGEQLVYPTAFEDVVGDGVQSAVNVDETTAVMVRDRENGQLYLHTRPGLFYPTALQEIESIQHRISLEDHETVIIKDKDGRFIFKHGTEKPGANKGKGEAQTTTSKTQQQLGSILREPAAGSSSNDDELLIKLPVDNEPEFEGGMENYQEEYERSFFLQPYSELVELTWTFGDESRKIIKIDRRPTYLNYSFVCRTCDNVELVLDVTFFWRIVDVKAMIQATNDVAGDLTSHARSVIIEVVSQFTLEKVMAEFNRIISAAILNEDDHFYARRGCQIHTVEVRSMRCKDESTEAILREIIEETTHRLSRLQQTESDNEVKLYRTKGLIEHEKMVTELFRIRAELQRQEAQVEGQAEADAIKTFMTSLKDVEGLTTEAMIGLWNTLRRKDVVERMADSNSTMYFTPADVNLSIETFENPLARERVNRTKKNKPSMRSLREAMDDHVQSDGDVEHNHPSQQQNQHQQHHQQQNQQRPPSSQSSQQ